MCWTTSETDCEDAVTVYKDGTVVIPGLTYTPNLRMGRDNKYGIPIPGLEVWINQTPLCYIIGYNILRYQALPWHISYQETV